MNKIMTAIGFLLASILSTGSVVADDLAKQTYGAWVNARGDIRLPENYRQNWSHLGSWLVADPKAPGHGFHDVYTQRDAVETFRKTGRFPDGAVLIKEIRTLESGERSTGKAQWAGKNSVWFVMVKDGKGRFTGNSHWGDGWGWALFEGAHTKPNASKGYLESCQGCHLPAKSSDWVYIEGYPTLKPWPRKTRATVCEINTES